MENVNTQVLDTLVKIGGTESSDFVRDVMALADKILEVDSLKDQVLQAQTQLAQTEVSETQQAQAETQEVKPKTTRSLPRVDYRPYKLIFGDIYLGGEGKVRKTLNSNSAAGRAKNRFIDMLIMGARARGCHFDERTVRRQLSKQISYQPA